MKKSMGNIPLGLDAQKTFVYHFGAGNVATDGVVYSPVATFGTTAVEVLNELVDPGYDMDLKQVEVGLTQSFTELLSATGSLMYYWKARGEYYDAAQGSLRTTSYVGLHATISKALTTVPRHPRD